MTLDPRAEMTLELSRRAQEPSAADHARNLASLRERLGLAVPTAAAGDGGPVAGAPLASELPAPRAVAVEKIARAKLAPLAGVAVTAAAIGFFVGSRFASPPMAPAPMQPVTTSVLEAPPAPAMVTPLAANEADVSKVDAVAPLATRLPDAALERAAAVQRRGDDVKRRRTRRDEPAAAVVPPSEHERATADTSFMAAVRLLRRTRSALAKGEPGLALALLDEIDQRFPRALLDEERGATRVLALCAHDRPAEAKELAQRLLTRYPRSIYAPRIEQSCAGKAATP